MKKKILFMVQLPPPVHGASLRNESLLKSPLLNQHFLIRVVPLRFVDSLDKIGGFSISKIIRLVKIYLNFLYEVIFHRPDFAYFTITPTGGAFLRDAVFSFTLKLLRIKIVYHLRGLGIKEASVRSAFARFIYKFVFGNVTVVCIGKNQVLDLNHLPVKKFFVAPDGLQTEVEAADLPPAGTFHTPLKILYLSNLVISKGVHDFLDTLKKVADMGLDFRAQMIGAAADVTAIQLRERAAELGLADRVFVEEPVFGKAKFKLFLDSDIFFFPTYFELFPGVVLEAMQCARPVVTTRTGCIPEMVDDGENGLLVTPRSTDEMASALKLLMEDNILRKRLGTNAREKFLREFTLPTYEKNMKDIFDQC